MSQWSSSKFTIWGWGKQKPQSMPPFAPIIFVVPPKMLHETYHIMTNKKEESLLHYMFHVLHDNSFSFLWFYLHIIFKYVLPDWGMLHRFYLLFLFNPLQLWVAYDILNVSPPKDQSSSTIFHGSITSYQCEVSCQL
jgi:hypothetical protein